MTVFFRDAAHISYEKVLEALEHLSAHPGTALEFPGKSEEGRPIPALCLGDRKAPCHVLLQGAIHAREHMTAWLLTAMAERAQDQNLPRDICWHFLPMMNPDAVEISQRGLLSGRREEIYRQDLAAGRTGEEPERYARRWKANALGTDLNRNFPAGWELLEGPGVPSSENFRGEAPFSAAEARTLRDYTLRYPFAVTVSYHASGSVIYYEYGKKQPVNRLSRSLGEAVAAVTGYPMEGSAGLAGGGYKDWAVDSLGIPSLTIEIGRGEAPLRAEEARDIWERNREVLPAIAAWLQEREENQLCPLKK